MKIEYSAVLHFSQILYGIPIDIELQKAGVSKEHSLWFGGNPKGREQRPVGRGIQRGRRSLGGRFPKEGSAHLGARFCSAKSSVLYLL